MAMETLGSEGQGEMGQDNGRGHQVEKSGIPRRLHLLVPPAPPV